MCDARQRFSTKPERRYRPQVIEFPQLGRRKALADDRQIFPDTHERFCFVFFGGGAGSMKKACMTAIKELGLDGS